MATEEKKFLGTAGVQQLITNTRTEIAAAEKAAKDYADSLADNYDAAGTAATKVQELADGQVKTNKEAIGTMDNLETTAKSDLVTAINEVRNAVSVGGTAAAMTMEEKTTGLGDGVAKAYVLKQGDNTVGTINIPKDMVVQSGEVVTNPAGQATGTYIKLTLANATNDVIYVNVGTLVDIYKAKASATQVQLAIDSATREISATIVAGSVTATELAANAVVTAKIADGNVTKAKLSEEVNQILNAAQLDSEDLANVIEVAIPDLNNRVKNLEAIDHEHANATQLATYDKTQTELLAAAKNEAVGLDSEMYQELEALIMANGSDIDKLEESLAEGGATATAIASANSNAINAMNKAANLENGVIATNTSNIAGLRTDVDALKSVSYVEITAADINTMFAAE